MKKALFIFGTRPEAIKLAPLIKTFQQSKDFITKICITSQHKQLLTPVLEFFKLSIDYDLDIMSNNQSLFDITTKCLSKLEPILQQENPDLVVVQGDTSTAFTGALAAFYFKIPVAHIEAGLRNYNRNNPFPEEMNRCLISKLASYHFAPTDLSAEQLKREGITQHVWQVGNTIIDALHYTNDLLVKGYKPRLNLDLDKTKQVLLVTGHRRENSGNPFERLCNELLILSENDSLEIVFTLHLNPNFKDTAISRLQHKKNIHLIDPQPYPEFISLIKQATLIITDSGGIQEEAPFFGKPLVVTRKNTERSEILNHNSILLDLETESLSTEVLALLTDKERLKKFSEPSQYFGNGKSSELILSILNDHLS